MPKNALTRKDFKNEELGLQVRATENEDGSISISAEDTAIGFGWMQQKQGKAYVRWETINSYCSELGFSQQVGKDDYIPESLFYLLGMKANNEVAQKFQKWLAMDVIPSIRKNGAYMTDNVLEQALENPDFAIGLLTKLKEEKEVRKQLELQNAQQNQIINELQPKATYYDFILQSNDLTPISLIAKDYGLGAPTLNKKLHDLGVQYNQGGTWLLYAKYQDKGYTQSKTSTYQKSDGNTGTKLHTQWTQKGRLFIYDLLKQQNILPVIEREENA